MAKYSNDLFVPLIRLQHMALYQPVLID